MSLDQEAQPRKGFNRLRELVASLVEAIATYSNLSPTRRPMELEDVIVWQVQHGVALATVSTGDLDLGTAAGRRNARILAGIDAGQAKEWTLARRRR